MPTYKVVVIDSMQYEVTVTADTAEEAEETGLEEYLLADNPKVYEVGCVDSESYVVEMVRVLFEGAELWIEKQEGP